MAVRIETRSVPPRPGIGDTYDALGIGAHATHAVQFYEDEKFLVASVADFLASGLALGQPAIAITVASRADLLRASLETRGFDVERAELLGRLALVDAHELLATFMRDGRPNPERCRANIGGVLRGRSNTASRLPVRVFGEMVDILAREGNVAAALQLEALWNELARTYKFSLLCGYSLQGFRGSAKTDGMSAVCETHAHVLPAECYFDAANNVRMRDIALLQQRAQALEQEIAQRESLENSLREALKQAEAANRAKSQFLAVMSHELRTPLNAIGGHVQLIEMGLLGPLTDKQRDGLARVQRSQRHLLGLINDVLNLARLESGQIDYANDVVDVRALVEEVTSLLEPLFLSGAIRCTVQCTSDDAISVAGDAERIRQILLNLLGNAIKFTPSGGEVVVSVFANDDVASIEVRDSGIGIAREKLECIFEPFVQVNLVGGQKDGVGLGLSISRTLARGMGGQLRARSEPGSGSIFTLDLRRTRPI